MKYYSNFRNLMKRYCGASRVLILFAISTLPLSAHPGHELGAYGATHVVTSPFHLASLVVAGILFWCAARLLKQRLARRLLQISSAATIAVAGLLWFAGV